MIDDGLHYSRRWSLEAATDGVPIQYYDKNSGGWRDAEFIRGDREKVVLQKCHGITVVIFDFQNLRLKNMIFCSKESDDA